MPPGFSRFNVVAFRTWLPVSSIALAVVVRFTLSKRFPHWRPPRGLEIWVREHSIWAAILAGALLMALRAALLPWLPMPVPRIYDEFSYLLMADTFACGRAANPSPHHWEHFETMFVQVWPTYQSAYPPAQGLFLAAGWLFGRHPWWGVWIEMGLFAAVLCWMLQGWLPPRWMLLGLTLAFLQFGLTSYWMNSYWGGAPSAIGGALLLGAWPRLPRQATYGLWITYSVGLLLLANSRPWEGLVIGCAISAYLAYDLQCRRARWQTLLPAAGVLMCGALGMGWYFWRVTGSPVRMPYQMAFEQYAAGGVFFWQPLRTPVYRHPVLKDFYTSLAVETKSEYSSPAGITVATARKMYAISRFYVGPLVFLVLLSIPVLLRAPRTRRILVCVSALFSGLFVSAHFQVHYAAPMASGFVLLSAAAMRQFRLLRRNGWFIVSYLIPAAVILMSGSAVLDAIGMRDLNAPTDRMRVLAELARSGAKHLVLVRYTPQHAFTREEWVYNDADLVNSPVVWARDMGKEKNLELIRDYPDRRVWLAEPDSAPPKVTEYR